MVVFSYKIFFVTFVYLLKVFCAESQWQPWISSNHSSVSLFSSVQFSLLIPCSSYIMTE